VFPPPTCRPDFVGYDAWWAADGSFICSAGWSSCVAECDHDVNGADAWFAECTDETDTGCDDFAPLLIVQTDCS
jgi:hypothetical protein